MQCQCGQFVNANEIFTPDRWATDIRGDLEDQNNHQNQNDGLTDPLESSDPWISHC